MTETTEAPPAHPKLWQPWLAPTKKHHDPQLCGECRKCGLSKPDPATLKKGDHVPKNPFMPALLANRPMLTVPDPHPEGYILVVGKVPDPQADENNTQAMDKDYKVLQKLFKNLGITDRVIFQSAARCPVGLRQAVTPASFKQCAKHLEHDIAVLKPKAIIALGADACKATTGKGNVVALAGQRLVREQDGIPVFPIWALGYVMRNPNQLMPEWGKLWEDAIAKIDGKGTEFGMDYLKPVVGWTAHIVEGWFSTMLKRIKDRMPGWNRPMTWDLETRGNKPWGGIFRVGNFSFYHPVMVDQPLIVPWNHQESESRYNQYLEANEDDPHAAPSWKMEQGKIKAILKMILESPKIKKCGHNIKFDENGVCAVEDIHVKGFECDTMDMAYVYNPNRQGHFGLDDLCREMLSVPDYWVPLHQWIQANLRTNPSVQWDYTIHPWDMVAGYGGWDVFATSLLEAELRRRMQAAADQGYGGWFVRRGQRPPKVNTYSILDYALHCRSIHHKITAVMEQNGQSLDNRLIPEIDVYYTHQRKQRYALLMEHPDVIGFIEHRREVLIAEGVKGAAEYILNWKSPVQLREFFINYLKLPSVHKTDSDLESTDSHSLKVWANKHKCRVAKLLTDFREADKFLTTYVEPLKSVDPHERIVHADGMVHSDFKTASTRTGRLSSANPNCFPPTVEVLTDRGWQFFGSVSEGSKIAQVDLGTGHVSFAAPLDRIEQPFEGDLLHLQTELFLDIVSTANHRYPVVNRKDGRVVMRTADQYPKDGLQICSGKLMGGSVHYRPSQIGLICAFQADAYVTEDGALDWKFHKERKYKRLLTFLKQEGIPYTDGSNNSAFRVRVARRHRPQWLQTKRFTTEVLDYGPETLACFCYEIWHWDGDFTRQKTWTTTHKPDADIVQAALTLAGHRATLSERSNATCDSFWVLNVTQETDSFHVAGRQVQKTPYQGTVYCYTMPHDTLVVRHNGKVVVTGNSQNMPRRGLIKRLFNSRFKNGWLIQRDYSGLEVRVLTLFSRDEGLVDIYMRNGDVHMNTQTNFFAEKANKKDKDQRSVCKQCLFGNIYGQGDNGLFDLLTKNGVMSPTRRDENDNPLEISIEECVEFNKKIKDAYPGVADLIEMYHSAAIQKKWCSTAFGFVRPLPEMEFYEYWDNTLRHDSKGTMEEEEIRMGIGNAKRQSVNSPIQGTAGDITIFAAWMIHKTLRKKKMKAVLCNCVHDSIYVDAPDDEVEEVIRIMASIMDNANVWLPDLLPGYDASWMDVPIIGECEIGLDAKDVAGIVEEPCMMDATKELKFKVPTDEKTGEKLLPTDKDVLTWSEGKEMLRAYLNSIRTQPLDLSA